MNRLKSPHLSNTINLNELSGAASKYQKYLQNKTAETPTNQPEVR